jgi:hypothetical protein
MLPDSRDAGTNPVVPFHPVGPLGLRRLRRDSLHESCTPATALKARTKLVVGSLEKLIEVVTKRLHISSILYRTSESIYLRSWR